MSARPRKARPRKAHAGKAHAGKAHAGKAPGGRTGVQVVLLAGGAGTRFWPAGRRRRPKQVLALLGADPRPLLAATADRVAPLSDAPPWLVAPAALLRVLRAALPDLPARACLAEPEPRGTAAALLLAAHVGRWRAPGRVLLAVPADHHVAPLRRYRAALGAMARRAARTDAILTLGLAPTRPATGYGYLRVGAPLAGSGRPRVRKVDRFLEKPTLARARRLVRDRRHLWNGGTFAFRAEVLLEEGRRHLPEVALPLEAAFARGIPAASALRKAYRALPSISVDHGIMERTARAEVVPADLDWDDLGSWDAVARHRIEDPRGNQVEGSATLVDARRCFVRAEGGHVALLGVEDLVVVRTPDAVLVARRGRGEEVRDVVERLTSEGRGDLL